MNAVARHVRRGGAEGSRRPAGFWASATVPLVYVNMPKSGCTTIKNLLHRIDSGAFLDDPLTIHGRPELMVHSNAQPEEIERRLKTRPRSSPSCATRCKRAYSCFNEKIHFSSLYSFAAGPRLHRRPLRRRASSTAPSLELHRDELQALPALLRRSRSQDQRLAPRPALVPADHGAAERAALAQRRLHRPGRALRRPHGRGAGARRRRPRLRDAADERGPAAALALRGGGRRRDPRARRRALRRRPAELRLRL